MNKITLLLATALTMGACGSKAGADDNAASPSPDDTTATAAAPECGAKPDSITFALAGDIMMGSTFPRTQLMADDAASLFQAVAPLFQEADVAAANLEGVLLDGPGTPKGCRDTTKCFTFKMPTRYASRLTDAGLDFVSVANNHVADFGAAGMASTHAVLDSIGLAHAGLKATCPIAVISRGGLRIGFTAFDHNTGCYHVSDLEALRRIVTDLKEVEHCDLVVVSMHGGAEGKSATHVTHGRETFLGGDRGNPEAFAHAAIDAGADLVYGHGPHVVRAAELYRDRLILYSLGNFATPYGMNLSGISGQAPLVTVTLEPNGRFRSGQIHSFVQTKGVGPRPDAAGGAATQMRQLTASDFPATPLSISPEGRITRK